MCIWGAKCVLDGELGTIFRGDDYWEDNRHTIVIWLKTQMYRERGKHAAIEMTVMVEYMFDAHSGIFNFMSVNHLFGNRVMRC